MLQDIINEMNALQNQEKAKILQNFFKTGPGQYGEGDIFLGIQVPVLRKLAQKYILLSTEDIETLLKSSIHEQRFLGLTIIRINYEKTKNNETKQFYYELSLKNISQINNWDLVDTFCPYVMGDYLYQNDRNILYIFAQSSNLWERRISILSTFGFIKKNDFSDTLKIAEILLYDSHDLIQKAVGWMLREVGKREERVLIEFLEKYASVMPRTMLRYAIEKLENETKQYFMTKKK